MMVACSKTEIQQTTDHIKRADSLFTKANEGFKTLDSISKTINNSDGIAKKVIVPEIEKQKKVIDSTIKSGSFRIDSINKEIEKITKNVKTGTDVVKTLDSAKDALNNGENPIAVLTKTADRLLKQTKSATKTTTTKPSEPQQTPDNTVAAPQIIQQDPLVKTAKMQVVVSDLANAKSILKQQLRDHNSDLVTEDYSQNEGIQEEHLTIKVPLKDFDALMGNLANLGDVRMKNTVSEGTEYKPEQMCDIEITLTGSENTAQTLPATDKDTTFGEKSSGAFMRGFKVFGDIILAALPFWPIFLIGGLVWYFVRRNQKNKKRAQFERQQIFQQQQNQQQNEEEKDFVKPTDTNVQT